MGQWKDNGEKVYYDTTGPLKRLRQWIIRLGGWEHPWLGTRGQYGTYFCARYMDGMRAGPTPIALFGHRIVFFGWGGQINFWRHPYWYITWAKDARPWRVYVSRDGTPPRKGKPGFFIVASKWMRAESARG